MKVVLLFLLPILFLSSVSSYLISIDANEEQCYFDRVNAGTTIGLMFEVASGGFLDIDVKVTGPDGREIHKQERETSGKYTFAAYADGIYTYCFSNKMSTMTLKTVMFTVEIAEPQHKGTQTGEHDQNKHDKLEQMVNELSKSLTGVMRDQEYIAVRDRAHKSVNDSTNNRVLLWAIFEAVIMTIMACGEVWYLKRFFEVRSAV